MELASAQASQGADECSMRHGSVEDQIHSTDSMDSFASAARTESRSPSPSTEGLQCAACTALAKGTVMGGQQVRNQACRPCNDGGVTVTTQ